MRCWLGFAIILFALQDKVTTTIQFSQAVKGSIRGIIVLDIDIGMNKVLNAEMLELYRIEQMHMSRNRVHCDQNFLKPHWMTEPSLLISDHTSSRGKHGHNANGDHWLAD